MQKSKIKILNPKYEARNKMQNEMAKGEWRKAKGEGKCRPCVQRTASSAQYLKHDT